MMRRGFTLIELAVVLLVVGLLVGGVLSGRSLLRASELRSVSSDFTRYQTAARSFRDQYRALPGDMANATQYWGALDADPNTCRALTSTNKKTCNGDGSGVVGDLLIGGDPNLNTTEKFHFWVQLASAGLVEGDYSGFDAEGDDFATVGVDLPRSKIDRAGFSIVRPGVLEDLGDFMVYMGLTFPPNMLSFGTPTDRYTTGFPALKPAEAWSVDTKLDDGKPGRGKMLGFYSGCASTTVASTSEYNLASETTACALLYAL